MIEGLYFFILGFGFLAIYFAFQMVKLKDELKTEKTKHADTIYNLELYRTKYNVEIEDLLAIIKNDWEKLKQLCAENERMQADIEKMILKWSKRIDTASYTGASGVAYRMCREIIYDLKKALEDK